MSMRVTIFVQPVEQGNGGRQQRLDMDDALPAECLSFAALRSAMPLPADEEMQSDMGMRIDVFNTAPWGGRQNGNAQFFHEFTSERVFDGFTGFDLAAREFPVTGIGFAFRSLSHEHIAIFLHKNADGDIDGIRSCQGHFSISSHRLPVWFDDGTAIPKCR